MKTKKITIPARTVELTFAQHVGQNIRNRRKELGLTQDDIVKACDISKSFLSEVENGKRCVGFSKIYELSRLLKCPTDYFAKGWD